MRLEVGRNPLFSHVVNGGRLDSFLIVDHHGHFDFFHRKPLETEVHEIVKTMDLCCIDRAVVFHCGHGDYAALNDTIMRGISFCPERFIGYAFITMAKGVDAAIREIDRCRGLGMRGLKLHGSYEVEPFTSGQFVPIWARCAELHWPVIIHGMPPMLPRNHPDTLFVGAHHIEAIDRPDYVETARTCMNCYWDTSSTFCRMGAIARAVEIMGSERLIFGSDYNGNNMAARLGSVLCARISEQDARNILGRNIARILKLEPRKQFPM